MRPDTNAPATAVSIGDAVLKALGLNDTGLRITRVQIDLQAGGLFTATVTQVVSQHQGLALCELLEGRFDLVPKGEWERKPVMGDDTSQA